MKLEDLPYLHARGDGGPRKETRLVVIHATGNDASDTAEASYATWRHDKTSAHFYTDADSSVRALPLGHIAYGCHPRGNAISVQFELVGLAVPSDAVQRQVAPLVAEVCRRYDIPMVKLSPAEIEAGARGICGHADVVRAFHQGDHTDPGAGFPWSTFLGYVRAGVPADTYPAYRYTFMLTRPVTRGDAVRVWQARMAVRGWRLTVDGIYGPESDRVCRSFQREKGLTVDGIVGPVTWRSAWTLPIT